MVRDPSNTRDLRRSQRLIASAPQPGRGPATTRRRFLVSAFGAAALSGLVACAPAAQAPVPTPSVAPPASPSAAANAAAPAAGPAHLRIGYQKSGILVLLKGQKLLEKRLGPGSNVSWNLFTSGPPLLEAMNVGSIDFGTTGETPPIFAQAAGTPLVYVASTLSSGAGSGVVVPESSALRTGKDLKGKKVALTKASSAHLLLIRVLDKFGLTYADVQPIFLQPPDARAAFQGGSVDAWVIWDPFYSAAQQEIKARVLVDGKEAGQTRGYFLAHQSFVRDHPDLLKATVDEMQKATTWAQHHTDEYAQVLADETGVGLDVWKQALKVDTPDLTYIDDATIAYQQKVADIFLQLGLIPKALDVRAASWTGA